MNVLVDTSVWSLALRRRHGDLNEPQVAIARELGELIKEGRAAVTGPVRQEVLSGIRDERTFRRLRDRLRAFDDVVLEQLDFEDAARFKNICRAAGVAGSAIDFLICAIASRRDLTVFTTDEDFKRYSEHLPVTLHGVREDVAR